MKQKFIPTLSIFAGILMLSGSYGLLPTLERPGQLYAQSKDINSTAALMRGRRIFEKRCVMCHGVTGRGDGLRAVSLPVRPANLATSKMSVQDQMKIIRLGGAAVGRSPLMPVWGSELSQKEIQDLVSYLQAINVVR